MDTDKIKPEEFYKKILDNIFDGVYFVDTDKRITYWNAGAERLTGYKADEVVGRKCADNILIHLDKDGNSLCLGGHCPADKAMESGKAGEEEIFLKHKDGHRIPVETKISPIRDEKGAVTGAVEIFRDNSSKMAADRRIEHLRAMAMLDPLTGLGNRRYINITLNSRIHENARYNWNFGIIFLDIDHFKKVNDDYGHKAGDKVLRAVAKTLVNNSRPFDVFGRWGGEEFIGIIVNVDEDQLKIISERLKLFVEKSGVAVGSNLLKITVSIGATVVKADDTADLIIKRADRLLYQSKQNGRNLVSIG
jgi:diguanylate cyclase (GGDEF)-like protein/PAS domain S-box-containing protein